MAKYTVAMDVDATYYVDIEADSADEAYEKARDRGFQFEDRDNLEIQETRVATVTDDDGHTEEYY